MDSGVVMELLRLALQRGFGGRFAVCYESGGDGEKGRAAGCGDVEREEVGDTCVLFWEL